MSDDGVGIGANSYLDFMPVITVTLDTNLFYDRAERRQGTNDFDAIVELARIGRVRLYFTATTDFEDKSGGATHLITRLRNEGVLEESSNAGTPHDFMLGAPGLHLVGEKECDELLRCIWPGKKWKSATDSKRSDVYLWNHSNATKGVNNEGNSIGHK